MKNRTVLFKSGILFFLLLTSLLYGADITIAKWKNNKQCAFSLQFDDATPGQAALAVPALVRRGLAGTWYVTPGTDCYKEHHEVWEKVAPEGGQELANHTMHHTGANDSLEIEREVGDAARIIWEIRGQKPFASLIAFNRGGGTSWDEELLANIVANYKNIDRTHSMIGEPNKAWTVSPGSTADDILDIVPLLIEDGIWGSLFFHGIAAENGNPPMDEGWAAVWIKEFEALLDTLSARNDEYWFGGYTEIYKYIKERQGATVSIKNVGNELFSVILSSTVDSEYYDEPLTLMAKLDVLWKSCVIIQQNNKQIVPIKNGVAQFEAFPNHGEIEIKENTTAVNFIEEKSNLFGLILKNINGEIIFKLSKTQDISVNIYSLSGELIKSFKKAHFLKGTHRWSFLKNTISSGVYLVELRGEQQKIITPIHFF